MKLNAGINGYGMTVFFVLQSYQSRVGLLEFCRVVNDLEATHKDVVMAMGFGGLLDLNLKVSRNGVAYELLCRFNV